MKHAFHRKRGKFKPLTAGSTHRGGETTQKAAACLSASPRRHNFRLALLIIGINHARDAL
jgi:hypothetical protein